MPSFVFESSSFYCTTGVNFLFLTSPIYMLTSDVRTEDIKTSFDSGKLIVTVPKKASKKIENNEFIPIE